MCFLCLVQNDLLVLHTDWDILNVFKRMFHYFRTCSVLYVSLCLFCLRIVYVFKLSPMSIFGEDLWCHFVSLTRYLKPSHFLSVVCTHYDQQYLVVSVGEISRVLLACFGPHICYSAVYPSSLCIRFFLGSLGRFLDGC